MARRSRLFAAAFPATRVSVGVRELQRGSLRWRGVHLRQAQPHIDAAHCARSLVMTRAGVAVAREGSRAGIAPPGEQAEIERSEARRVPGTPGNEAGEPYRLGGHLVFSEVSRAEESARVLDLLGRGLVDADAAESWESVAELAAERAAIMAEGEAGNCGLVSIPTSRTERDSASKTQARGEALRRSLRAVAPDQKRSRLARMRCAVGVAARGHEAGRVDGFRDAYCAMLTLTYRGGVTAWEPYHLSRCIDAIKKYLRRRGVEFRYVWVAELQKRGVIHYHLALWLPAGVTIPKADRRGWWPHGASNIKAARKPVAYLMKYLSKGCDVGGFPKGARTHGAGGLEHSIRRAKRWCFLPSFIRARADVLDDWRRAPGGGWWNPDGVCIPSEFIRAWVGDKWACLRVADYGRPFPVDGPFSWVARGRGQQ